MAEKSGYDKARDYLNWMLGGAAAGAAYEAGQNAAKAAQAEAAYNIAAAHSRQQTIKANMKVQLRSIANSRMAKALAGQMSELAERAAKLEGRQGRVNEAQAAAFRARAKWSERGAAIVRERAGLKTQEASLTDELAALTERRSALAMEAADVARQGIANTRYNMRVQEELAQRAIFEGEFDAETVRLQTQRALGAVRASAAARGIQVDDAGSVDAVSSSTTYLGQREESRVRREAALTAYAHEVKAKNLEATIAGQELQATGHELSGDELERKARETALGATLQRWEARDLHHRAAGQVLQAQEYVNRAAAADVAAQGSALSSAKQMMEAKRQDLVASRYDTEIAKTQAGIQASLQESADLERRKLLFAAQGRYGARAAKLQGVGGVITALGTSLDNTGS